MAGVHEGSLQDVLRQMEANGESPGANGGGLPPPTSGPVRMRPALSGNGSAPRSLLLSERININREGAPTTRLNPQQILEEIEQENQAGTVIGRPDRHGYPPAEAPRTLARPSVAPAVLPPGAVKRAAPTPPVRQLRVAFVFNFDDPANAQDPIEYTYHDVVLAEGFLVLVHDPRSGVRTWFPRPSAKPMALYIEDHAEGYVVQATPFRYPVDGMQHALLTIQEAFTLEAPLP